MAAGAPDSQPLQAGLSAQQLVTPMQPVANTDAVTALVDAFHKGIITAGDINDRIGAVAQANKRAHLQQLSEFVSPEAINSRMAQYGAQGAQAQLQTAQSQAGLGLVAPLTEKAQEDIVQANEERLGKPAMDAFLRWNAPVLKKDADGNPIPGQYDYPAMRQAGVQYIRAENMLSLAAQGLKGTPTQVHDPKTGQPRTVWLNANGEDVTPIAGNKAYEFYQGMRRDAFDLFHNPPSVQNSSSGVNSSAAPADNTSTAPTVTPLPQGDQGATRASFMDKLIKEGADPGGAARMAANASPETLQSFIQQQTPAAPSQPPVIQPAAVQPDAYMPFQGLATGPIQSTPEAKTSLEHDPYVETYSKESPIYLGFADAAKMATATPHPVNDLALAEAYTKLFDPTARITEFKYDELKKAMPWIEKFKDAPAIIARNHTFPPEVRNQIVQSGMANIDLKEKALTPKFQYYEQQHPGLLDEEQKKIADGVPFSQRHGVVAATSTPGNFQTLPSGKRIRFQPTP